MNNAAVLKLLIAVKIGGDFDGLLAAKGAALDSMETAIDDYLNEIMPDRAYKTITDWERVYGITPAADSTLAERRMNVINKMRDTGGLSRQRFISIAALLGQTITIIEYQPTRCGVMVCGDEIAGDEKIQWMWTIKGLANTGDYARCGEFCCGEALSYVRSPIESIFETLKPAHTIVCFDYNATEESSEKIAENLSSGVMPSEFTVAASVNWELYAKGIKRGSYGELKAYAATKPTVPFLCIAMLDDVLQLMFYVGDPARAGTDDGFIILAGGAATTQEVG